MLTADWNCRYWGYLYQRYNSYERYSKIFLAVTSSSTVAGWTFWTQADWIWKSLSALSALLAISVPYLNWQNSIEKTMELRGGWLEAKYMYEKLWRRIESGTITSQEEIESTMDEILEKQRPLDTKASSFPNIKSLAKKCQQEVLESRNLL